MLYASRVCVSLQTADSSLSEQNLSFAKCNPGTTLSTHLSLLGLEDFTEDSNGIRPADSCGKPGTKPIDLPQADISFIC